MNSMENDAKRLYRHSAMKFNIIPPIVILNLLVIFIAVPPVFSGDAASGLEKPAEDTGPVAFALKFFRKTVSRADGRRCTMYPSCSHYSGKAIEQYGFVKGWAMTADRLLRCGRDERQVAEEVFVDGQAYVFDPLERNVFWWDRP